MTTAHFLWLCIFIVAVAYHKAEEETNSEVFPDSKRSITFVNEYPIALELYWSAGDYVSRIATLGANSDTTIESFNNHVFFTVVEKEGKLTRVGPRTVGSKLAEAS